MLGARPDWKICAEASDGAEGVEKARALRPDVVLMDVSMPRMNGLEAARILHKELPRTKVVIVSQNDPAIVSIQAREVRASAHVAKQELFGTLLPVLERLIGTPEKSARPEPAATNLPAPDWLAGSGQLGELMGQYDWSKTPLGRIENWNQSLKTSVNLMLSSQHPMWIGWGPDATFLYNDAYIQVLGSAKHPWALGKPAAEVWAEIWDYCGPMADKVFEKGEASFVDEVRLFMNRGDFFEETYYSYSYSPIRDESGRVGGLFCVSTEVTPKVINARRLRTLSELSANAFVQKTTETACASAVATLAKNPDDMPFALLYVMEGENERLRLQRACGLDQGVPELSPGVIELTSGSGRRSLWPLADVLKTIQPRAVPIAHIEGFPLGPAQQRLSQAIVLPVTSRGEGRPVGVLIAGINPTRRLDAEYQTFFDLVADQVATAIQNARAAEEERKRLDALAELDRAKTAFFSNVSHEFRTPLTLMLGPVEELLSGTNTDLSAAARSQLELVNRSGDRLLRLVNTLLDFSRLEAGRMQATYQATDLSASTIELASVFRSATEKAGLGLELDCPPLTEPVYIDRLMWEKIVLNLVSNAFKFTFEGKIAVSIKQKGRKVELRVSDSGVGIPQEELPRVFERFHQIENTRSRTHEGSGIGLALVQELVKLHGGSIRVESVLGKGTTFTVTLPLGKDHLLAERISGTHSEVSIARDAATFVEEALRWLPDGAHALVNEQPATSLQDSPQSDAVEKKGPRVLVVDDNADMRQYLVHLLADRYQVRSTQDGEAALAAIQEDAPDLVLTDVMMPRLDGFGLIRELRSDPKIKKIPVIVLSARAGEEARVEGMEQGADDYLIKPFSARELLARVNTHLQMARLRNESEEVLSEQVRLRTRELETRTTKVVQQSEQLRDLSHKMLQMQDDERRHVARELHDSAGQILAALGMSLAHVAQTARTSAPHVVAGLQETQQLVDQLSKEIRTMSYLLHPPLLDESGLPVALHWYAEGLAERSGLKISVNVPEDLGRFGRDMELTIFRLVQECLTNIHRHSGSKTADISVWADDRELGLEIRDQGRGIPPERLASIQAQGGGVGIRGMRERIHPFQGTMEIESNDSGTRISFRIPVPRETVSAEESPDQPLQVPA